MKFIDLSHTISNGMHTYKGLPPVKISDFWSREYSSSFYDKETSFHIASLEMVANSGTYIDTPFHRYEHGSDLSEIPLDKVAGLKGVCIHLPYSENRVITSELLSGISIENKAVLIHTGWDEWWGQETYQRDHPYIDHDGAEYLASCKPLLVGIDSYNIDNSEGKSRPVHSLLLKNKIYIIEHMCNLGELKNIPFRFFAIPPKIKNVGSFPVRAFAITG